MEMEAGSPAAADPQQDSKRVRKLVPTVSLAVSTLCCGIYASVPPDVQLDRHPPIFYNSLISFVSLGVFTSLGLFMHSLVRPEGAEVAWIQKKGVTIAIIFFLIAFVLRIALLLPVASFGYVWQVFSFVAAVIALYLYAASGQIKALTSLQLFQPSDTTWLESRLYPSTGTSMERAERQCLPNSSDPSSRTKMRTSIKKSRRSRFGDASQGLQALLDRYHQDMMGLHFFNRWGIGMGQRTVGRL
ncbi:hypothetical protein COCNU_scaffold007600G000010 [Cocos nucifera]|nr:hypothetical protein [Cocos nucifera]